MSNYLHRSISEPIRTNMLGHAKWEGSDRGLIWCWERGRQKRLEDPQLARDAEAGALVPLAWKGGVKKKQKAKTQFGSLQYLATWQGLRNEDLRIDRDADQEIICSKTGKNVVFTPKRLVNDDDEEIDSQD